MSLGAPVKVSSVGQLRLVIHGAPEVLPPIRALALIGSLPYPHTAVTVELVPRILVHRLWARDFPGKPFPGEHAFRAYTRDAHVVILVDKTETQQSLIWLLLHELSHVAVNGAPALDAAFRSVPRPNGYLTSDAAHESWPEEQFANAVADRMAPLLGSQPGLNRLWWRQRTRSAQAMLRDPSLAASSGFTPLSQTSYQVAPSKARTAGS